MQLNFILEMGGSPTMITYVPTWLLYNYDEITLYYDYMLFSIS